MDDANRVKTIQGVNELQNPALVDGQEGEATEGASAGRQLFEVELPIGGPAEKLDDM